VLLILWGGKLNRRMSSGWMASRFKSKSLTPCRRCSYRHEPRPNEVIGFVNAKASVVMAHRRCVDVDGRPGRWHKARQGAPSFASAEQGSADKSGTRTNLFSYFKPVQRSRFVRTT
jgi:hypothetical protein